MTKENIKKGEEELNDDDKEIIFTDRIIKLLDGTLLIGRLIMDKERDNENFIYVYIPLEIIIDEGGSVFLEHWIPMSKDTVYTIQVKNLINLSRPDDELSERYNSGFESNEFSNPKNETLDEFEKNLDHNGIFH